MDLGVGDSADYEVYTRECAEWLEWNYERLPGDPTLIKRFVAGDWDAADFLIVEPGQRIAYVSGTASIDDEGVTIHVGDLRAQTWRTYRNLTRYLRLHHGAGWALAGTIASSATTPA